MRRRLALGLGLIALSALAYFVHFLIFRDAHHIFIYMVGDIAFVPIEVLLVTMILHELLTRREKARMFKKLNMVIGAFFNELGTDALALLATFDTNTQEVASALRPKVEWTNADFQRAVARLEGSPRTVDAGTGDLVALKSTLSEHRGFLLRLLENPNLLEHESFTDLLWALFHLADELENRRDLAVLPKTDLEHLSGDIERAYGALVGQWLAYMRHLKSSYPYLYSLALRTNPFDPTAQPEVA